MGARIWVWLVTGGQSARLSAGDEAGSGCGYEVHPFPKGFALVDGQGVLGTSRGGHATSQGGVWVRA